MSSFLVISAHRVSGRSNARLIRIDFFICLGQYDLYCCKSKEKSLNLQAIAKIWKLDTIKNNNTMNSKELMNKAADNIRILAASMVEKAKSGHPGGAMGGADFINVLFSEFLE